MPRDLPEPEAPCGVIGPCTRCTPWGFGVAFLSQEARTAPQVADAVDGYWSATYLTRVFDQLVRVGVLESGSAEPDPAYALRPAFIAAVERGDLFGAIDAHFAQWRPAPDARS